MIERRKKKRYPLALPGSYLSRAWIADGEAVNISSSGLLFRTLDLPPFAPAGAVQVELDWPARLHGTVPLKLRCRGHVVWSRERLIAMKLFSHDFRLRGCLERIA